MPLFWLSLAFLVGIWVGEFLEWSIQIWLGLSCLTTLLGALLIFFFRKYPRILQKLSTEKYLYIALPVVPLFLCLGALRLTIEKPHYDPSFIGYYSVAGDSYVVEGVLTKPPDRRDQYTNLTIETERLHPRDELLFSMVSGRLLAVVEPGENWRYGDLLRVEGKILNPPESETFSYREYLAHKGIYAYMPYAAVHRIGRGYGSPVYRLIYRIRDKALETVYQLYPDPEASLLAGILLGIETGIPEHVQDAFRNTGTSHIIVISGFNITILAGLFMGVLVGFLGRHHRFLAAGVTALIITAYTILVGADAAVVRAVIMGYVSLLAAVIGRRQTGLNTLAITAAVMALSDPFILWDVSFQLSFMATLGLILYAEPMMRWFESFASRYIEEGAAQKLGKPVGEYFLFTLAAQLAILPVLVYHFQRLSISSIIANPLILPAQPPVMILGGLATLLGMIFLPLGRVAAMVAWPFVVYTIRVVEWINGFPGGVLVTGQVAVWVVLSFFTLLFFLTFAGGRIRSTLEGQGQDFSGIFSRVVPMLIAALLISSILVWREAYTAPDGLLHVYFMDVGEGEAVLVQSPDGRQLLINGGGSPSKLSDSLGRRMPLTHRNLDFLIVAAAGDENLGGFVSNAERFLPQKVLWSGPPAGSRSARQLREILIGSSIPILEAKTGQTLNLGKGAQIHILGTSSKGAVLQIMWQNFELLLPVGLNFDGMNSLLKQPPPGGVTAMLLSEGGYAPVNTPEWINFWDPSLVLISVNAGNRDGRPDQLTLETIKGRNILRTDQNGWIHMVTDGEKLWVETERN